MQTYDYCCYTRSIVMKKILIFISLLLLVSCSNYNSVEEAVEESSNILFCYKEYSNYEEYIEFSYKDNVVEYINFSYNFNKNIKEYNELDEYQDYIKYQDKTIDLIFESIDIDLYKRLKNKVVTLYNLEQDKYNYIENNVIKYDLFRNYLEDYSCE